MTTASKQAPAGSSAQNVHPVDEKLPFPRLFMLGLQHVLAMYAGAVAVPLIVGGALIQAGKLNPEDMVHLIVADLFVAGIGSIIQSIGFWRFGSRLPLIQGVSFVSVAPMISIGSAYGVTAIYGSVIATGLMMILVAPVFSHLVKFFPTLVTGTIMTVIGLSLVKVPAGWIIPKETQDYSHWMNYFLALFTLVVVIMINVFSPPQWKPMSILGGVIIGAVVSQFMGINNWSTVAEADWVGIPTPFLFGLPTFEFTAILTMFIVGLVIMTETSADIIAVGNITGRRANKRILGDGLRADGLSTVLGGLFNTFPYTAFAQNVGLVSLSRVFSRYVITASGVILVILGLIPKLGEAVAVIPTPVLGGAGVALFGMVTASGIRSLSKVEWNEVRALIVGVSISIALLPTVSAGFYDGLPEGLGMLLDSGIAMGAISVITLNLLFNRAGGGHLDYSIMEEIEEAEEYGTDRAPVTDPIVEDADGNAKEAAIAETSPGNKV